MATSTSWESRRAQRFQAGAIGSLRSENCSAATSCRPRTGGESSGATAETRYKADCVLRPPVMRYIAPSGPVAISVTLSGRPWRNNSAAPRSRPRGDRWMASTRPYVQSSANRRAGRPAGNVSRAAEHHGSRRTASDVEDGRSVVGLIVKSRRPDSTGFAIPSIAACDHMHDPRGAIPRSSHVEFVVGVERERIAGRMHGDAVGIPQAGADDFPRRPSKSVRTT